jgi:hypothetical protein
LYPTTKIVEPYAGIDVVHLMSVQNGAEFEQATQDGAGAVDEETGRILAAWFGERPGAV